MTSAAGWRAAGRRSAGPGARGSAVRTAARLAALAVLCAGCSGPGDDPVRLPPPGVFDYQLGGAYDPAPDVVAVVRDATAEPAPGLYSVCYVNGFQTQPQERERWVEDHPDLLLRDADGVLVADPEWPDELLLDISTDARREAVADVVAVTVRDCAERGFDAVEFDNLDSHTRSGGAFTDDDALALAADLVAAAHDLGMAAAQKNAAELAERARMEAGFDMAVAEECVAYDECAAYTDVYGDAVLAVEYPDTLTVPFAEACAAPDTPEAAILRDRDLVVPGDPGHVFDAC